MECYSCKFNKEKKHDVVFFLKIDQPQLGLTSRDYYVNSTINNQAEAKNKIVNFASFFSDICLRDIFRFEKHI
jgi:hypothetical protein